MSEVLTQFLETTAKRIPTVEEMLSVCDDIGITFKVIDGKPFMRPCPTCVEEAKVLAKLFKREPFRSAVLGAKLPGLASKPTEETKPEAIPEPTPEPEPTKPSVPNGMPANAIIVVADAAGYTDKAMKGEPYMWTWIGGETWFYVADYSIPTTMRLK